MNKLIEYIKSIKMVDCGLFVILCFCAYPLTKYNIMLTIFVSFMAFLIIKVKPKEK